ncbi:MAG: protein kinase [Planctomycetes bacterium]|nr:protein kinase [Planctomycetota bacterium]
MSARLERVKLLYERALHLEPDSHAEFLQRECADDPELRQELAELLRWKASGSFLSEPIPRLLQRDEVPPEDTGAVADRIGSYRLIERIASGGMGTVWCAVRDDETFAKEVAIKLIKRGMDSAAIVQRFHRERRLLAQLEHPGIARILDGGTSAGGQPYMVMELVHGVALDVGAQLLPLTARLELFAKVCDAVDAAHELGIVHRDLKPSNILITPEGEPKLLDFGIAKLIAEGAHDSTLLTRTAERLLTPRYASPEQVLGGEITTATDVYALGVLLYELLCAHSPYESCATIRELETAICGDAPRRPSAKVRGTTRRQLRGDLDTIALRAMAKEPERRYPRAGALAADLRRHLRHEPISARRDSAIYRAHRFVRRNKILVISTLVVITSLAFGLGYAMLQHQRAEARALEARWTAYVSALESAQAALRSGRSAHAALQRAPEELRGWEWRHLRASADLREPWPYEFRTGSGLCSDAAGARFALRTGGEALVVDASTRAILFRRRIDSEATPIHISADGALLLLGEERAIRVIEVGSGVERTLAVRERPRELALQPDGRWLAASLPTRNQLELIDIEAPAQREQIGDVHDNAAPVWSRSGRRLVFLERGGQAFRLWSPAESRSERVEAPSLSEPPVRADFSPDEDLLAFTSAVGTIWLWSLLERRLLPSPLRTEEYSTAIRFHPRRRELIASGSGFHVFELDSGRRRELPGPSGPNSTQTELCLLQQGTLVVGSGSTGLNLWRWDAEAVERRKLSRGPLDGLAIEPRGQEVAVRSGQALTVSDLVAPTQPATLSVPWRPGALSYDSEGRWLTCARRGAMCFFDRRAGTSSTLELTDAATEIIPAGSAGAFLVGSVGGELHWIEASGTARVQRTLASGLGTLADLDRDPASGRIVVLGSDGRIRELDPFTKRWTDLPRSPEGRARQISYGCAGVLLAACAKEPLQVRLSVWHRPSGALAYQFVSPAQTSAGFCFSPDGTRIVLASSAELLVLDAMTGRLLLTLRDHKRAIHDLGFLPDGISLLAADASGELLVRQTLASGSDRW